MMIPQGGSPLPSPRQQPQPQTANYVEHQQKRLFSFENAGGNLTQETIQIMLQTIKSAMSAGQGHARVQTLRIGRLASYIYRDNGGDGTIIHNQYTLQPFEGEGVVRLHLNVYVKKLTDWLYAQGVHFIFTSERTSKELLFGQPVLSNFVHVVVVFIPENPQHGQALVLWNTVHMQKCLDTSMIPAWSERLLQAIRLGASHFFVSTLYYMSDYEEGGNGGSEFCVREPRHHLTMMPFEPDPKWVLNKKFLPMVSWIRGIGYTWTLCSDQKQGGTWAYFTVLLNPLTTYYA